MAEGLEGSWPFSEWGGRVIADSSRTRTSTMKSFSTVGWSVVVAQQVVVLSLESAEEGSVNSWRGWWAVPLYVWHSTAHTGVGWIDNPPRGRREMTWKREFIWKKGSKSLSWRRETQWAGEDQDLKGTFALDMRSVCGLESLGWWNVL